MHSAPSFNVQVNYARHQRVTGLLPLPLLAQTNQLQVITSANDSENQRLRQASRTKKNTATVFTRGSVTVDDKANFTAPRTSRTSTVI